MSAASRSQALALLLSPPLSLPACPSELSAAAFTAASKVVALAAVADDGDDDPRVVAAGLVSAALTQRCLQ